MFVMLIRRGNKYCSEPTPYQAQAMGWRDPLRLQHRPGAAHRRLEKGYASRLQQSGKGIDRLP
jgi:hypothetical protein